MNQNLTAASLLGETHSFLFSVSKGVSGGTHFRTIPLAGGKMLGVDVFQDKKSEGHVRVHVYDLTEEESAAATAREGELPRVPTNRIESCAKCQGIPPRFPARYPGGGNGSRVYYGFQWHVPAVPSEDDLTRIKSCVAWLLERFPL